MRIEKYLTMTVLFGALLQPILTHAQQTDLPAVPICVKAKLVNTLESGAITPVVGVVSEDVWRDHKKVIPNGAEIFGLSNPEALKDRIGCNNQFIIVYPDGVTLRVQGIVLDRDDADADHCVYGPTDGSYGMKGEAMKIQEQAFVRVPAGHPFYLYVLSQS